MKIEFDFTNVPQKDIDELTASFKSKINWIASGGRDRYEYRLKLEQELQEWSKPIRQELTKLGICHKNTSYSEWEYGYNGWTISFPYTLAHTKMEKPEDFSFSFVDYINKPKGEHCDIVRGLKTVEEVLSILIERNLYKLKVTEG